MNDMMTLTLLPQERLTLASGLESRDLQRYRRLAQDLASQHADISRVMASLGVECEQQLDALQQAAERMELGACVTRDDTAATSADARAVPTVDAMEVSQALEEALTAADEASRLSRVLLDTNVTPELETALLAFARHKQEECGVLREFLTVKVA